MTMELAGDRPPRYEKKRHTLTVGRGPVPRHRSRKPTLAEDRPALPEHQDQEVSPTGEMESLGVSRNPFDNNEL